VGNNRFFENGVELTGSEWQIDTISDCGDKDRCTFFDSNVKP